MYFFGCLLNVCQTLVSAIKAFFPSAAFFSARSLIHCSVALMRYDGAFMSMI